MTTSLQLKTELSSRDFLHRSIKLSSSVGSQGSASGKDISITALNRTGGSFSRLSIRQDYTGSGEIVYRPIIVSRTSVVGFVREEAGGSEARASEHFTMQAHRRLGNMGIEKDFRASMSGAEGGATGS